MNPTALLFGIFLLLALGAVIAFSYFVIKPLQTLWAIRRARGMVAAGKITSWWRFRNVSRILATAPNDLDAAYLWQKLRDLDELTWHTAE